MSVPPPNKKCDCCGREAKQLMIVFEEGYDRGAKTWFKKYWCPECILASLGLVEEGGESK